jgi:quercetin dioxygenase-like cupin family protein
MKTTGHNMLKKLILGTALLASLVAIQTPQAFAQEQVFAQQAVDPDHMLSIAFEQRKVTKIEVGDFHFIPGQRAPVHTHTAPAIGYVSKGTIVMEIEGRDPIILQEGDVYYEPVGPRITMFDNVSPTKEAVFIDLNLEQEGEPFIVFENPPTENIDRRTLPEITYETGVVVDGADIYSHTLQPDAKHYVDTNNPISAYVAKGNVEVRQNGKRIRRLKAGDIFYHYKQDAGVVLVNTSSNTPAKVIVFSLHKAS